jgi:isopentenyl-diphosphate delta-isomerase type 1
MTEMLILVDADDHETGHGEKLKVHREGQLHRAFSLFIFDMKGRLLLQRRAKGKYHSGHLWTNTCCGHPRAGESTDRAATRRLDEEMGFSCDVTKVATFTYHAAVSNDLIEHEFDHLYVGGYSGEVLLNPEEASDWQWIELDRLFTWMEQEPEQFTPWIIRIIKGPHTPFGPEWLRRHAEQYTFDHLIGLQAKLLMRVSKTYALAIPQLPAPLAWVVTYAYLLLRITDTIEDEPALSPQQIRTYEAAFVAAVKGQGDARRLRDEVAALLTEQTVPAEHALMRQMPLMLEVHHQWSPAQRKHLLTCLEIITRGMDEFCDVVSVEGLETCDDLDRYCYCVAGSVGEMLTELFIDFDPTLLPRRDELLRLSVSFGAALQLANIIKDLWEDRERGMCWCPKDLFAKHGVQLSTVQAGQPDFAFARALNELIGTTHEHLQQALSYVLCIPSRHTGIRRFVSCTLGLALLVLVKAHSNPFFTPARK